uniref:Uncharacterized protein n=1 Tax=Clytia hemisphaerica TaxID=252671 RepID=A0A7M5X7U2_9CNID
MWGAKAKRKISQPFRRLQPVQETSHVNIHENTTLAHEMETNTTRSRPRSKTLADISQDSFEIRRRSEDSHKASIFSHLGHTIFVHHHKSDKKRVHGYKSFKILVLGVKEVGKTSIIKRFINGKFNDEYLPTISEEYETGIFLEIENKLKQFDLVFKDFGGDLKTFYPELYKDEVKSADGFILVHTENIPESFAEVLEMVADIQHARRQEVSIMILENQSERQNQFDVFKVTRKSFIMEGMLNDSVSAKMNYRVDESIAELVKEMEKKLT